MDEQTYNMDEETCNIHEQKYYIDELKKLCEKFYVNDDDVVDYISRIPNKILRMRFTQCWYDKWLNSKYDEIRGNGIKDYKKIIKKLGVKDEKIQDLCNKCENANNYKKSFILTNLGCEWTIDFDDNIYEISNQIIKYFKDQQTK